MPLTIEDFPSEVQVAFFIYSYLSDRWEGMSGMYLGKDWSNISFLFKIYGIEEKQTTFFFCKLIEREAVTCSSERSEAKRKAEERRTKNSAGPGKTYAHNVQG
jgi:hypothetical protein|tara:strand:+ start:10639 stop:10947 length:309 start_codon:yes stop_codon:yes gene_type:complete